MNIPGFHSHETTFVDTPEGLFTASGMWFRTREVSLRAYAGPVFERESLPALLTQAEVWLRSPQTLALWALPALLYWLPPLPAVVATVVLYAGWAGLGPSFVSRMVLRLWRLLDLVPAQALYYVLTLSVLAAQGHYAALWVGLGGFILLRWGIVERAARPVVKALHASLYRLPVADHVLRALIVRAALKHRVSLPELDRIEQDIIKNLKRKP